MNLTQLQQLAASVGFPDPALAAAVAMAESNGNPSASCINCFPGVSERSFGLWEINTLAHPQYNEASLLQPLYNAQAAYAVSSNGTNWTPWSTYTSGAYKKFYQPMGITLGQALILSAAVVVAGASVAYTVGGMKPPRLPKWLR